MTNSVEVRKERLEIDSKARRTRKGEEGERERRGGK
jgi:hypothetical protein